MNNALILVWQVWWSYVQVLWMHKQIKYNDDRYHNDDIYTTSNMGIYSLLEQAQNNQRRVYMIKLSNRLQSWRVLNPLHTVAKISLIRVETRKLGNIQYTSAKLEKNSYRQESWKRLAIGR